ncbi:heliX-turN-helix motif protein [Caudoviricetes sp.]|nr:heliX-turN-helix motif protein [Caudoviricetes sp.]UOF79120.1 heliX-turN-helix motif protein [Caudoviricetes sp.]
MKEHLVGGTLRKVMVDEVLRILRRHNGRVDPAAIELGITPRTLRLWKAKWPEFKDVTFIPVGGIERVLNLEKPPGKPPRRKPKEKKKSYKPLKMKASKHIQT